MKRDLCLVREFEGRPVTTLTFRGKPAWIAKEVGKALGYEDEGRRFVKNVTTEWADELVSGSDFEVVAGAPLRDLRDVVAESATSSIHRFAPSVLVLYESGLHLSLMLSRKPAGKRLRRFLADEVLPQLVREGRFEIEHATEQARLLEAEAWVASEDRLSRVNRCRELRMLARSIRETRPGDRVGEELARSYEAAAAELVLGRPLSQLEEKPVAIQSVAIPVFTEPELWIPSILPNDVSRIGIDRLATFILECCVRGENHAVRSSTLFQQYQTWCRAHGFRPLQKTMGYSAAMDSLGFPEVFSINTRIRRGLTLKGEASVHAQVQARPSSTPVRPLVQGIADTFLDLIRTALTSGSAHLARRSGRGITENGRQIGWIDDTAVFMDPDAAMVTARETADNLGTRFEVGRRRVAAELRMTGRFVETSSNRGTCTVRRTIKGSNYNVWIFRREDVVPLTQGNRFSTGGTR